MVDLVDIPSLDGADNMPGVATEIAVIAKRDIQVFAVPAEGEVAITTAHTLKSGKGFTRIYNTLETGELMSESKGGIDGRYQGQNYKGFIPGLRPEVMKNLRIAQNTEMLVIITDSNGRKIQIGSKEYPAYMKISAKTGKVGGDDVAGYEIEINSYAIGTFFYNAPIEYKPDGGIVAGVGVITASGGTETLVTKLNVVLNGIKTTIGQYVPQSGDGNTELAAGLAASVSASGIVGVSATSSGDQVTVTLPTSYNGWSLEIEHTIDEFNGTAFLILAAGSTGDVAVVKANYQGVPILLGSYEQQSGDTNVDIAVGLASSVGSGGSGFTASTIGNKITIEVPSGTGMIHNGTVLTLEGTGGITNSANLAERTF